MTGDNNQENRWLPAIPYEPSALCASMTGNYIHIPEPYSSALRSINTLLANKKISWEEGYGRIVDILTKSALGKNLD